MGRFRYSVPALVAFGLLAVEPRIAAAAVDPECYEATSFLCQHSRREDASVVDAGLSPALATVGWLNACFTVMYIAGDRPHGLDAFVVTLLGPPGASEARCKAAQAGRPRRADLDAAMQALDGYFSGLTGGNRATLRRRLGLLVVVDGQGGEIRRRLR